MTTVLVSFKLCSYKHFRDNSRKKLLCWRKLYLPFFVVLLGRFLIKVKTLLVSTRWMFLLENSNLVFVSAKLKNVSLTDNSVFHAMDNLLVQKLKYVALNSYSCWKLISFERDNVQSNNFEATTMQKNKYPKVRLDRKTTSVSMADLQKEHHFYFLSHCSIYRHQWHKNIRYRNMYVPIYNKTNIKMTVQPRNQLTFKVIRHQ